MKDNFSNMITSTEIFSWDLHSKSLLRISLDKLLKFLRIYQNLKNLTESRRVPKEWKPNSGHLLL